MNLTNREYLEAAIASIKILRKQSPLTEQERGILLAFPGGGILKECGVFTDADKPQWLVEGREELRSLLTDEEWEGIQNSGMQNSHYTLPRIREAMWEAIMPLLPHNNHIQVLDPGCGTAGFLWSMPNDVRLEYHGVDKDALPVAIAQKAIGRSKHRVIKRDFFQYDPNPLYKYGVTIGNVPFVNGVNNIKVDNKKLGIAIHAQFFVKSVQHLEAGGVLCFLTSTTTLDARGEDYVWFRRWLHRKCEFLGALRLPADAVHHGNTQVTTDLIMIRRRSQDSNEPDPNWVHVGESDLINEHYNIPVLYNQWFIDNPQYLLGDRTISKVRGKNGNPTNCLAIQSRPNFLKELRESLAKLTHQNNVKENHIMATLIPADKFQSYSVFSFILRENPKQQGVEIHFPPEYVAESDAEKTLLEQIKSKGFVSAKSNPSLFYIKPRTTEEHAQLMAYMRKKVAACAKWGACELDGDVPVEEIKSRRRWGGNKENKPVEPVVTPTSAPIVDAIAQRLQPMFDELASKIQVPADPKELQEAQAKLTDYLHRWQKDQETFKALRSELDVFVGLNEDLKKDNEDLRSQLADVTAKIVELNGTVHELQTELKETREADIELMKQVESLQEKNEGLRSQLAEFGVGVTQQPEPDLVDDEPDLQDEPVLDEPDLSDDETDLQDEPVLDEPDLSDEDLPSAFQPQSSDDDDEDGFNIALLGIALLGE
jgi:hypothetical protein